MPEDNKVDPESQAPLLSTATGSAKPAEVDDDDVLARRFSMASVGATVAGEQHPMGSVAMLFTKGIADGGVIDETKTRETPYEDIKKFFSPATIDSIARIGELKPNLPVKEEIFQDIVRSNIAEIFHKNGMQVTTKPTIDKDETFAIISVDPAGAPLKLMASRIRYIVPYSDKAYQQTSAKEPKKNSDGDKVYAVGAYVNPDTADKEDWVEQQPFTEMDMVKILMQTLNMEMHIENLEASEIIKGVFPLANLGKMAQLDSIWIKSPHLMAGNVTRDYFGEEIGYFFKFLGYMTRELRILGAAGLCMFLLPYFMHMNLEKAHEMKLAYCLFSVMWTAIFMSKMKQQMARCQQCWGMSDYQEFSDFSRAEYKPELEGTTRLTIQKGLVKMVELLYPVAFASAIYGLQLWRQQAKENQEDAPSMMNYVVIQYSAILLTVLIQVFSIGWSTIAPKLASLENPRFNSRWEDILAGKLFFVTCFVALWNFIYLAFVKRQMPKVCVATIEHAAAAVWKTGSPWTNSTLEYLEDEFTWKNSRGKICLSSCYPPTPADSAFDGNISCVKDLESTLTTFFLFQLISVIVSVVMPIIKVKMAVQADIKAAKDKGLPTSEYDDLQVQGKCKQVAGYGYGKGGGSKNEDFMNVVVSYGLLVTFGIIRPLLAPIALVAFSALYKLLAYRMVHVTARPEPRSSKGIDNWIEMFESLSKAGILTNTALAVFDLLPMRKWSGAWQLAAFLAMEHILLLAYGLAAQLVPSTPEDVSIINDQIADFSGEYPPLTDLKVPEGHKQKEKADVGLRAKKQQ